MQRVLEPDHDVRVTVAALRNQEVGTAIRYAPTTPRKRWPSRPPAHAAAQAGGVGHPAGQVRVRGIAQPSGR